MWQVDQGPPSNSRQELLSLEKLASKLKTFPREEMNLPGALVMDGLPSTPFIMPHVTVEQRKTFKNHT